MDLLFFVYAYGLLYDYIAGKRILAYIIFSQNKIIYTKKTKIFFEKF